MYLGHLLFTKELNQEMIYHSHLCFLLLLLLISLDGSLNLSIVLLLMNLLYNRELVQKLYIINRETYLIKNFLVLLHHYRNSIPIFVHAILHYEYKKAIHVSQPCMFQILMQLLNIFCYELMTLQLVAIYFPLNRLIKILHHARLLAILIFMNFQVFI